jgi:hypothetical protein
VAAVKIKLKDILCCHDQLNEYGCALKEKYKAPGKGQACFQFSAQAWNSQDETLSVTVPPKKGPLKNLAPTFSGKRHGILQRQIK